MGMPRVTAPFCRSDSPVMCVGRSRAVDRNQVWYDREGMSGWYWVVNDLPTRVSHCLSCGCPLPLMGGEAATYRLLRRALDEPLGNPEE